MLETSFAATR